MKPFTWTILAALAACALPASIHPSVLAADNPTTAPSAADAIRNTLEQAGAGKPTANNPAPDTQNILGVLSGVTEEAVTKADLVHLADRLVTADRDRVKKSETYKDNYGPTLDGRIQQITQSWKQKYGHDMDVADATVAFGEQFADIQQGQIGRDDELATAVLKNTDMSLPDAEAEKGRSIAMATLQPVGGLPELKVPMIHELPDSWKINAPSGINAQSLRQNLLDQLTALGENSSQWPDDENQAYRLLAHRVLMAVLAPSSTTQPSP